MSDYRHTDDPVQYACFNCEKDLTEVKLYTTFESNRVIIGNKLSWWSPDHKNDKIISKIVECPHCGIDLPEGELQ